MRVRLPLLALLTLASSACMVHVAEDGHRAHADSTRCSISCPSEGSASAHCAASEVPSCACAPAPAAACLAPARGQQLL